MSYQIDERDHQHNVHNHDLAVERNPQLTVIRPAAPMPAMALPANIIAMFCAPVLSALPIKKQNRANCIDEWRPKTSARLAKIGRKTCREKVQVRWR